MKNLYYFFFGICLSLFACTKIPEEIKLSLLQAEQCMDAHPDSALNILLRITEPQKLRGSGQADYALLLSQAKDKNFMDETSDSLILIAVDYYDNEQADPLKRGKALYYYGRVQQEAGENEQALQTFLKAKPILEKTKQYRMLGLMMEDVAHINLQQLHKDEAVNSMRKAIEYYRLCNENLGVALAYQHIGRIFVSKCVIDSVQWYAGVSIKLLPSNPPKLKEGYYELLSSYYKMKKNYPEAMSNIMKAIFEAPDDYNIHQNYLKLGHLYLILKKYDEATSYLTQCLDSRSQLTQADAYLCLSRIAKLQDDFKQAYFLNEKSDSIRDLVRDENIQASIVQIQRKYQYEKYQKENLETELEKTIHFFIFVVLISIVLLIAYLIYRRFRAEKTEGEKKSQLIKRNEQKIDQLQQQIEKMIWQNLDESDLKIKDLRQQILLLANENRRLSVGTSINMPSLIDDLKKGKLIAENFTQEESTALIELVNAMNGHCVENIQSKFNMKKRDTQYICMLLLGFTPTEMAIVFDCDNPAITRRKMRLKERLHLAKDVNLEEFIKDYASK